MKILFVAAEGAPFQKQVVWETLLALFQITGKSWARSCSDFTLL